MRIFNEHKTEELFNVDLEKGYLKEDQITHYFPEQLEIAEQSHYEVIAEYKNGGKDVKKVIDVEYRPYVQARQEIENINIYIPYTEVELIRIAEDKEFENKRNNINYQIEYYKKRLADTDYIVIKLSEAMIESLETNDSTKVNELKLKYAKELSGRPIWRVELNELEAELEKLNKEHQ